MQTPIELLDDALPPDVASSGAEAVAPRPPPAWVPVRLLGSRHRPRILQHLQALSPADRALRFGNAVGDAHVARYVKSLDFWRDELFGVFDRRLRIVALAHLALDRPHAVGEFGVSVLEGLRGRGLGTQLFAHAAAHARNRGVRTMWIQLSRRNAPMMAIVRAAGATVTLDGGEAMSQVALDPPTWGTQVGALVEAQAAEMDFQFKWQMRRLDRLWPGLCAAPPPPPDR